MENGADAIYFGLSRFNARMRADNFTEADLPALMEFLHRRGVRGYVTFNTLVFADELPAAEDYLRAIIAAGVDAAIVQDVGVCQLIRRLSPDFPIHASTQMTVTSAAGVEFVRDLGCQLVVLARECSIKEIAEIHTTLAAGQTPLPLEVFVHGALCVAYSGQCLTSEALGGRSANRGECAQACRMPYELIADDQPVPLGDRRYLLSPQDLSGLDAIADLARAGVRSLKIEGRLKTPEYVAAVTRVYRAALDRLRPEPALPHSAASERYELEMGFSRGLHTGWLHGVDNQRLVHARFGKKRGVFLGTVRCVRQDRVYLQSDVPMKAGDGVVFDAGQPDQPEEGGRIYAVEPAGEEVALAFGRGGIDFARVRPGDRLWKTDDPELDKRLRQSFAGDVPRFQRPVDMEVHGHVGGPLSLLVRDRTGNVVRQDSALPLAAADQRPLTTERLAEQLGRLGGTPFRLAGFANHLEGAVIVPVSELNRLRRDAVAQLEGLRARPRRWQTFSAGNSEKTGNNGSDSSGSAGGCRDRGKSARFRTAHLGPQLGPTGCRRTDGYQDSLLRLRGPERLPGSRAPVPRISGGGRSGAEHLCYPRRGCSSPARIGFSSRSAPRRRTATSYGTTTTCAFLPGNGAWEISRSTSPTR